VVQQIIADCRIGPELFGVFLKNVDTRRLVIYRESNDSVLSYNRYKSNLVVEGVKFIEVKHFLQLIESGDFEANILLYIPTDRFDVIEEDMMYLQSIKDKLVNINFVRKFLREADDIITSLEDAKFIEDKHVYEIALKSQLCINILQHNTLFPNQETRGLIDVFDFTDIRTDTVLEKFETKLDVIFELLDTPSMNVLPDYDVMNSCLLNIRANE